MTGSEVVGCERRNYRAGSRAASKGFAKSLGYNSVKQDEFDRWFAEELEKAWADGFHDGEKRQRLLGGGT